MCIKKETESISINPHLREERNKNYGRPSNKARCYDFCFRGFLKGREIMIYLKKTKVVSVNGMD